MEVITEVPQFWFLLRDRHGLILTVNCDYSFVGYSVTIRLNPDETQGYHQGGATYLSRLAEEINFSCPIAKGSPSPFKARNLDSLLAAEITPAIAVWRAGGGREQP